MPYRIIGLGPQGRQIETRIQAASAFLLALRWQKAGIEDVTIREGEQQMSESVESFRRRRFEGPRKSRF